MLHFLKLIIQVHHKIILEDLKRQLAPRIAFIYRGLQKVLLQLEMVIALIGVITEQPKKVLFRRSYSARLTSNSF